MPKIRRNRFLQPPVMGSNNDMQKLEQMIRHSQNSIMNPPISKYHSNVDEINFHFNNLKNIARQKAPRVFGKIDFIHHVVLDHCHHRISDYDALEKIRSVILKEGLNMNIYNSARAALDGKHNRIPRMGIGINPLNEFSRPMRPIMTRPKIMEPLRLRKPKKAKLNLKAQFAKMRPPRWF